VIVRAGWFGSFSACRDEKVWDVVESVPPVAWEVEVLGRDEAGFVCLFAE
jgi:hypothetical protein